MTRNDWQRPFAHLNLCRNPFGSLSRERRGDLAVIDLEPVVAHLESGGVVQFLGRHGRGKSTALQALAVRHECAVYRRVSRDGAIEEWPEAPVWLIDEIESLDRSTRLGLWERDTPLAVSTHTDFTDEIRRAERSVLTVDLDDERSVETLAAMFRRRIEAQRRDQGSIPTVSPAAVRELRDRYGSDHRAMQDHLYAIFQELEEPRAVIAEDLEAVDRPVPETG